METQRILMRSLAVVFIASVIWTITAHPVEKVNTCCTEVSNAELTDPIIGFRLQKPNPPCVKAVIFQTERGEFCYDWTQPWVQKKVRQFFKAQRNKHLTSTPPPASSISEHTRVRGSTQSTHAHES
uniref:Chemokine ligand 34b n=1 Tax=Ctenopharyngodon idella TaxID=7959 RepID=A0A345D710_CTEID|nr:chemokine ligand 34b [Ctenopharyngodon idella]